MVRSGALGSVKVLISSRKAPLKLIPGTMLPESARKTRPTTPVSLAVPMNTLRFTVPVSEPRSGTCVLTAPVSFRRRPAALAAASIWMKPTRLITPPMLSSAWMVAWT